MGYETGVRGSSGVYLRIVLLLIGCYQCCASTNCTGKFHWHLADHHQDYSLKQAPCDFQVTCNASVSIVVHQPGRSDRFSIMPSRVTFLTMAGNQLVSFTAVPEERDTNKKTSCFGQFECSGKCAIRALNNNKADYSTSLETVQDKVSADLRGPIWANCHDCLKYIWARSVNTRAGKPAFCLVTSETFPSDQFEYATLADLQLGYYVYTPALSVTGIASEVENLNVVNLWKFVRGEGCWMAWSFGDNGFLISSDYGIDADYIAAVPGRLPIMAFGK